MNKHVSEGKNLSDESIHSYGQSLLAFCHCLKREELIEKPITTCFRLAIEEKFIPTFTSEEVQKLLDACEEGDRERLQLVKPLKLFYVSKDGFGSACSLLFARVRFVLK